MDIGGRIRTVRKAAGLTQEELARRADMSLKGMGDIERGAIPDPHYSSLSKIAAALNVPIGDLLEEQAPLARASLDKGVEERRGQIIRDFLSSEEEPFGELPAEERIKRLERWCEHFETLRDRRRLDRDNMINMIDRGELDYGRAMEMYALDELDRKRYFAEGVHTHTERVIGGELKASKEEWELCWRVNNAMGVAQNLTNEVKELVEGSGGPLERHMGQNLRFFLKEDVSRSVSTESGSAAFEQES